MPTCRSVPAPGRSGYSRTTGSCRRRRSHDEGELMPVTNQTPGGTQVNIPYGTGAPAPRAPSVLAGVGGGLNAAPKAAPRNLGGTNTGKIQAPAAAAQKVGAQVATQNQNVQTQQQ